MKFVIAAFVTAAVTAFSVAITGSASAASLEIAVVMAEVL